MPVKTYSSDTSYEPFSREPEYLDVNRQFIESLHLSPGQNILDLACGTGTITSLILEETDNQVDGRDPICTSGEVYTILGLDVCEQSLVLARRFVGESTSFGVHTVGFVQASGDCMPIAALSMDAVIVGNAIQLFNKLETVLNEVHRVLRLGGLFAFNTSFYAGTFVSGTERFYLRWVQEALNYVQERAAESRHKEGRMVRRKRGGQPAFSRPWLSQEEYRQLLERNGFAVNSVAERTVVLTQHSFERIGSYAGLASVLLGGYPVELACQALETSARPALLAVGMDAVPRYWLEFVASRT
jgi:ubiquinone/menaquinone biosynthesis C-methylase UbiE